jgi:hypothetical protein
MTYPVIPKLDTRSADQNGWYIYAVGEEMRCPGQDEHKKAGRSGRCNKYMGTVSIGVVYIRPEVRLHEGLERRQHPRFAVKCQRCDTALEIETRSSQVAA